MTTTALKSDSPQTAWTSRSEGGRTPFFQPKLTVNTPGDAYEQEADRVADQVMRMKDDNTPVVQRMPSGAVSGRVQREEGKPSPPPVAGDVSAKDNSANGSGGGSQSVADLPLRLGFKPLSLSDWQPKSELLHLTPPQPALLAPTPTPAKPGTSPLITTTEGLDPAYPIVPTPLSSESRTSVFSGARSRTRLLPGFSYLSFQEITPPQQRIQWGKPTEGARLDSYSALRVGNEKYYFDFGVRSTDVSSESSMKGVENQRIGFANLRLNWVVLSYWNDHGFWWWPLADAGDKGDTAGLRVGILPSGEGLPVGTWKLTHLTLNLRLASGDPVRSSAALSGGREIYQEVIRPDISRGDLMLRTNFKTGNGAQVEIGAGISSGTLRHFVQSVVIHRNLGIPEFDPEGHFEGYAYVKFFGK